ncbi:NAD(P)/FAD-dependent oxidoreductase [Phytohabitans rumicis]|uniref:Halogenase n=1 Tax=Phytohabitans rumicis TaxID=1076125 RepID=A0A6V8L5W2_9ACTN|nr:tryptophan 7-halogenase [Phytohabitans rumicis]GFJ91624.1 halogenase [Phytohabitans rumicis]
MSDFNASRAQDTTYDVVVLGSGLAGSVLAACLARNGARVLIVDAGTHPRFAIGESTIPYTSMMMRLVSERYGVPELKWLTTFEAVHAKVSTSGGVKRNFGFLYHRPGEEQDPRQTNMFPIPKITHTENHFFRQDTDNWMLMVAARYGATVRQQVRISSVDIDESGVTVRHDRGEPFHAKFIVDASGFRSFLAEQFSLREEPTRLRHHSRSLFTHMVGVRPYDEIAPKSRYHHPSPWHEGTLHHIFPGGWMWVIPFDNHPRATNPLCSVGVNYDPRIHPVPDCTPEEEFRRFIAQFPGIEPQFARARAVRDWTRTGRLQYSPNQTVGYRWCLTSHAAGFIDALFSRGLSNTMEIINVLVQRLLDAIKDDDFAVERFEAVQELEQGQLDFNDDLVANAYTSFGDWRLWDAWFRVWSLSQILATFEVNKAYAQFVDSRDPSVLSRMEKPWWRVTLSTFDPSRVKNADHVAVLKLLTEVGRKMQAVQAGEAEAGQTAEEITALLRAADFVPPAFGLAEPDNQWTDASVPKILSTLRWAKRKAPPSIGELTYDGLTLFMKKRFAKGEFEPIEEIKQILAGWPVIGRRLRVPEPK